MVTTKARLSPWKKGDDFPFEIQRVYYVWGTAANTVRGHHAHKALEQVIIVTSGNCDFTLDNGRIRQTVHLVAMDSTGNWCPTVGGILMASEHPEEFLPSAYVQAICYRK